MAKYCYNCGTIIENEKYCNKCGTDIKPPVDVYFTQEECDKCNENLPRWSKYCPKCGKRFYFTEPTDPKLSKKYNIGLIKGTIFFSIVFVAIAVILSTIENTIPLKVSISVAGGFILIFFIITTIRWERGKFKDGAVIKHFSEEMDLNSTAITRKHGKSRFPYKIYCTEVRFDDGTIDVFKIKVPANHIQLDIGDRLRYYVATRTYRKISTL